MTEKVSRVAERNRALRADKFARDSFFFDAFTWFVGASRGSERFPKSVNGVWNAAFLVGSDYTNWFHPDVAERGEE